MSKLKYKAGDQVRIKSIDWYNENKTIHGDIWFDNAVFVEGQSLYCGCELTIRLVTKDSYYVVENDYYWTDEMIEGLMEPFDCKKCGLTRMSTRCLFMDNCPHNQPKHTIEIPKGWIPKDENGNVINAMKIVLEKKKKEYPKLFVDCCAILYPDDNFQIVSQRVKGHKGDLLFHFQKLLICRDAYWKIAGEEMGLGKPWEPDWNNVSDKYCIYFVSGHTWSKECQTRQCPFAFPTPEMRDAFKENFDPDIEICKELL